jgi:hypothetical protein
MHRRCTLGGHSGKCVGVCVQERTAAMALIYMRRHCSAPSVRNHRQSTAQAKSPHHNTLNLFGNGEFKSRCSSPFITIHQHLSPFGIYHKRWWSHICFKATDAISPYRTQDVQGVQAGLYSYAAFPLSLILVQAIQAFRQQLLPNGTRCKLRL